MINRSMRRARARASPRPSRRRLARQPRSVGPPTPNSARQSPAPSRRARRWIRSARATRVRRDPASISRARTQRSFPPRASPSASPARRHRHRVARFVIAPPRRRASTFTIFVPRSTPASASNRERRHALVEPRNRCLAVFSCPRRNICQRGCSSSRTAPVTQASIPRISRPPRRRASGARARVRFERCPLSRVVVIAASPRRRASRYALRSRSSGLADAMKWSPATTTAFGAARRHQDVSDSFVMITFSA